MYGKHARRVLDALAGAYTVTSVVNPTKPVSKGFEVTVTTAADPAEGLLVWSGKALGPPRALKFPTDEEIVEKVQAALKKVDSK